MKQLVRYAAAGLLGLLATAPALAQSPKLGPWVDAPTQPPPGGLLDNETRAIQLPAPHVVWAAFECYFGSGKSITTLSESLDNGSSWQQGFVYSSTPSDFWALDGQRAWLLTYNYSFTKQTLLQTTTGAAGIAVAPVQLPEACQFIRFFDATTGVAIAPANAAGIAPIYRTTDGGTTWGRLPATPAFSAGARLLACQVIGKQAWVAVEDSSLLRSSDMGLTWTGSPTPARFVQLAFRDAQHGLAGGSVGVFSNQLFRTADGGATWSPVSPAGKIRLNSLAAVPGSAGTYLTVGGANLGGYYDISPENGTAISRDEGQTWQDLAGSQALESVAADPTGNAWATVKQSGRLVHFGSTVLPTSASQPAAAAIYPNPTTGRVQLPAAGTHRQVTVYDAAGRQCRTARLGSAETTLDLSGLGAGLYVLRLAGGVAAPQQQRVAVVP